MNKIISVLNDCNNKHKFYIGSSLKNYKLVDYYANRLKENGFEQTYDWVSNLDVKDISKQILMQYAKSEQQGIEESDVVIILLPGGRGSYIELGMALGLDKKIFLCSENKEEFTIYNTVAFYELPNITKLIGTADENIQEILKFN